MDPSEQVHLKVNIAISTEFFLFSKFTLWTLIHGKFAKANSGFVMPLKKGCPLSMQNYLVERNMTQVCMIRLVSDEGRY